MNILIIGLMMSYGTMLSCGRGLLYLDVRMLGWNINWKTLIYLVMTIIAHR